MKQFLDRASLHLIGLLLISPALPVADASVLGGWRMECSSSFARIRLLPASQKACKELRTLILIGVVLNTAEESSGYNSYYSAAPTAASDRREK